MTVAVPYMYIPFGPVLLLSYHLCFAGLPHENKFLSWKSAVLTAF